MEQWQLIMSLNRLVTSYRAVPQTHEPLAITVRPRIRRCTPADVCHAFIYRTLYKVWHAAVEWVNMTITKLVFGAVALTIAGCAVQSAGPRVVEPQCEQPVPLTGSWNPAAPGYSVTLREDAAHRRVSALEKAYSLRPYYWYGTTQVYFAKVDGQTLARMRCEPEVESIEYDEAITVK
jgi:hypothetical protein